MADAANAAQLSRARGKKTSQVTVNQRVSVIFGLLVAGSTRQNIVQAVANAYATEQKERVKFDAQLAAQSSEVARKKVKPPVWVWGDEEPALRTIDRYIMLAKRLIEADGKAIREAQLSDVVGLQWSRINALYGRAFASGQLNVCARLIEEVNEMFGLKGLVLLGGAMQTSQQPGDSSTPALASGDDGEGSVHTPETRLTGTQAIDELRRLIGVAAMRRVSALSEKAP